MHSEIINDYKGQKKLETIS